MNEIYNANKFDVLTEFPENLAFMKGLLERYDLDADVAARLNEKVVRLEQKHDDPFLNLSVIGEFSTGKSTFINALLRRDGFLESSSLQGTTTTATIIENSDKYALVLEDNEGNKKEEEYNDCDELKQRLAAISSDTSVASSLYNATIKLPAPLLAKYGFRVIDTPGTNSGDNWLDDVTIRTITEMSDLSIIIVDATKALPQQFCEFIADNLQSILSQCVFVITKVNMIEPEELEGVIRYIKDKAEKEFEITDPLILPYSSTDVLDYADKLDGFNLPGLVERSIKSEGQIMEFMSSQKSVVQTLNLISLSDNIYGSLQEFIDKVDSNQEMALSLARRKENISSEFRDFNIKQMNTLYPEMNRKFTDLENDIEGAVNEKFGSMVVSQATRIKSFRVMDDLNRYFHTELPGILKSFLRVLIIDTNKRKDEIIAMSEECCNQFLENFKNQFRELEIFDEEELQLQYKPSADFYCLPFFDTFDSFAALSNVKLTFKPNAAEAVVIREGENSIRILTAYANYVKDRIFSECRDFIEKEQSFIATCNDRFINSMAQRVTEEVKGKSERLQQQMKTVQGDKTELSVRKGKLDMVNRMLTIMYRKDAN